MTNLEYIREYYKVPARVGGRVRYTASDGTIHERVITDDAGPGVMIRLDGEKLARPYHPTWSLEYLDD